MSDSTLKPIVMIGGGGHASMLVDILRMQNRDIVAIVCPDDLGERAIFSGIPHFFHDDDVFQFEPEKVLLVNGIGVLPKSGLKRKLTQYYLSHGYQFETIVAETASVSPYARLSEGVQIFPGAFVNAGVKVGSHSIINTGAIIEHDSEVGEFNHIAPRALLCGQVKCAEDVFVGAGATVIQNLTLAQGCIVGASTTILSDVKELTIVYSKQNQKYKLVANDK
ncbi:acetyltransferase [Vibrio splendidus]|uniref:acetyltransferase n=1 Tax=Vibrio splendidus TaxID=29497 RepID=UPI003D1493F4